MFKNEGHAIEEFPDRLASVADLSSHPQGKIGEVLVLDDEEGVRESLSILFKPYYRVHIAKNTTEAMGILEEKGIDVITLDVMMPTIKGQDAIRYIREVQPQAEVIILTGYASADSAIAGLRYGAADYILKPFNTVELIHSVQRAIAKKRFIDSFTNVLENIGRREAADERFTVQQAFDFISNRRWIPTRSGDLFRAFALVLELGVSLF